MSENENTAPAVTVGTPATINLFSDTQAAVVVKVNKKSIVVRTVELVEGSRHVMNEAEVAAGGLPCNVEQGDITKPVGQPERYALVGSRYRNGSISITLGRSVQVRDYRY